MKKTALLASVLLAAALNAPAQAAVVDISHAMQNLTLVDNSLNFGGKFGNNQKNNIFSDKFGFVLNTVATSESIVSSISSSTTNGLELSSFDLYKSNGQLVVHGVQRSSGIKDLWVLPTTRLSAGHYFLQVKGYMVANTSASFSGNLNVTPVPEPETWGMMLLGLGALGMLARRRKAA